MKNNKIRHAIYIGAALALAGCGGSDGDDEPILLPPTPEPSEVFYDVTAIDGYLTNARAWLDLNDDNILDDGEPTALTEAGGIAKLDVTGIANPEQYPIVVQAIAGETIDEDAPDTPISNSYMMSSPPGEVAITPLTTLVHIYMKEELSSNNGMSEDEAKEVAIAKLADDLGIAEETILGDFIADGNPEAAYAAENIVDSNILPDTPEELVGVSDNPEVFLKNAESVSHEINVQVSSVDFTQTDEEIQQQIDALEPVYTGTEDTETDTDSDGVPDLMDAFPEDDTEYIDTDGDLVGNNADVFPNDPLESKDSDGDTVGDNGDAFPNDPTETLDSDGDLVGDNTDAFPTDPAETLDSDGDLVGDNADAFPNDPAETLDSDGDLVGDNADAFPNDPAETLDSDGDLVGDNADAFPNDPAETLDSDGDLVGDNADAFPNDPAETLDSDGDLVGDNADAFPNDPAETLDSDGDMVGDNADAFPNDPAETVDTDGDLIGDNADTDDDNDGFLDADDEFPLDAAMLDFNTDRFNDATVYDVFYESEGACLGTNIFVEMAFNSQGTAVLTSSCDDESVTVDWTFAENNKVVVLSSVEFDQDNYVIAESGENFGHQSICWIDDEDVTNADVALDLCTHKEQSQYFSLISDENDELLVESAYYNQQGAHAETTVINRFSYTWLKGRTLYDLWYGEISDANGHTITENAPGLMEWKFSSDGTTIAATGLRGDETSVNAAVTVDSFGALNLTPEGAADDEKSQFSVNYLGVVPQSKDYIEVFHTLNQRFDNVDHIYTDLASAETAYEQLMIDLPITFADVQRSIYVPLPESGFIVLEINLDGQGSFIAQILGEEGILDSGTYSIVQDTIMFDSNLGEFDETLWITGNISQFSALGGCAGSDCDYIDLQQPGDADNIWFVLTEEDANSIIDHWKNNPDKL